MCTVSWSVGVHGYDLFFNRDELHSRAAEHAPELVRREGVAYLAPHDGQHGGTWLGVNEFGLTICVLNDYAAHWQPTTEGPRFSRGHVVANCMTAARHADVRRTVSAQPLERTPAFQLLALSPEEGPLVLRWRRRELSSASLEQPLLTSSSFATDEIVAQRRMRFAALIASGAPDRVALSGYHREHRTAEGAQSVLMCRPDAATRSITHVLVEPGRIRLDYQPVRWTERGPVMPPPTTASLSRSRATLAV